MPDDVTTTDTTTDEETTGAPAAHDDIMKRLLDYQRSLRESSPTDERAEATRPLVDYSGIEAQAAATSDAEQIVDLTEIEDAEAQDAIEVIEAEEPSAPVDAKIAEAEAMRLRVAEEAATKASESPAADEASAEPEGAAAPEAVASVPAPSKPEAMPASDAKLAERVAELEASLDQIAAKLAAVRTEFQDLAIRADERIAEIEESLAAVRGSGS